MIKQQSGKYHLYSKDGSKHLGGPYNTRAEAEERERQVQHFKHAAKAEVSMVITKASVQADGSIRWAAVTSDTSPDNTGESTSLSLFQDWVQRTETGETVDYLPLPRKPFLGVSHYSDLSGDGEAGITDEMGVDGNRFKAKGVFKTDSPLGMALANAVKSETDLVKRGGQPEKPIRISAAWWDIEHSHGPFIFTRKSLTDVCPMCEDGAGNKVYLKGQLDHFATTRVPINPRTSLALQEKSMAITRKDDAASIVGDELAEELEKKSKLVGKSEAEGLVVKAKPKPNPFKKDEDEEDKAEGPRAEDEEDEETKPKKKKPAGGSYLSENKAFTMADARALPIAKSASRLELMALAKRNISDLPAEEQLPALMALMDEVHDEVTQIKEAVEEVWFLQPAIDTTSDDEALDDFETEDLPEMDFLQTFTDQVTQTLGAEGQTKEEKAAVIQKALNDVAMSLKAELEGPQPAADMVAAFKAALSPLVDQIAQLSARQGAVQQPVVTFPVQKSFTGPVLNTQQPQQPVLPVSPITGEQSQLTAIVRRSVGLADQQVY